jgi:two-component system NtrC family response regulator
MLLANFYLRLFSEEYKKRVRRFSTSALSFLKTHPWPGNVRELRNRIQRAVIMCDSKSIEAADLGCEPEPLELSMTDAIQPGSGARTLREARDQVERQLIIEEMERYEGNIMKTAEVLGVSRPTLYGLLKKHGLINV